MLHVIGAHAAVAATPRRWTAVIAKYVCAAGVHVAAASVLLVYSSRAPGPPVAAEAGQAAAPSVVDVRHIVFIARDPGTGGGGGGGGNRQPAPIRRAEGVGRDNMTLRIARPLATSGRVLDASAVPPLLLDARPLASGTVDQVGLPAGGVSTGTSMGPGSGGGVGDGVGTGIGSGRGPGIGPGSGGGIGGGVYRPGGSVTPPRVIAEVKPTYTSDALMNKIQGTVVLELVVRADGHPSNIAVIRSLDPGGLDHQAVMAASQWRFEPGRLRGTPVDVLVTLMMDFSIR